MRATLIAVGRAKPGPARDLFQDYAQRLSPPLALIEVEEKRPLPSAQLKAREAELLLAAVPKGATVLLLDERRRRCAPHLFQIVEEANLGPEQMDDDVAGIEQDPIAMGLAFDRHTAMAGFLELGRDLFGQCRDLAGRAAAGDHQVIRDARFAFQIDHDDVFGLALIEGMHDQAEHVGRGYGSLGNCGG